LFRRVIISRTQQRAHSAVGPSLAGAPKGRSYRRLQRDIALGRAPLPQSRYMGTRLLPPTRLGALLIGLIAVLCSVAGELIGPGIVELAFAALLLGCGLAAAAPRDLERALEDAPRVRRPRLDPQEQIRRHLRLLERRRHR
jgi:hypothetical protein